MPARIDLLAADRADDDAVLTRLTALVNAAYAIGEAGMWRAGVVRVQPAEIGALIRGGRLLALETDGRIDGCVSARDLGDDVWGFGMLAVDPGRQGGGGGRALVDAAEDRARRHGARTMQLELLVPLHGEQESKRRLAAWYAARGYSRVADGDLEHDHPELTAQLAVPCRYAVWQKPLVGSRPR